MKRKLKRGIIAILMGFVLLFGLRLGYGYTTHPPQDEARDGDAPPSFQLNRRNYASRKSSKGNAGTPTPKSIDQKYERIAETSLRSEQFSEDEKRVRDLVRAHDGLVQFEQKSGLSGRRTLHLAVGVDPARFDDFVSSLREIGKLASIDIHKVDKTNDYKELQAKRRSLEKSRASLVALNEQGGKLDELMGLQERILSIEERIQALGIQLGEFDQENEFCTVKLTLIERVRAMPSQIPFYHRAKVALEWTIVFYFQALGALAVGALAVLLIMLVQEKLAVAQRLFRKLEEDGT